MRPADVEDIRRYRYAAQNHSKAELRAAAACKALAWQGTDPTAAAVSKLADVEFSLAEETVDLWHGTRPLEVTRPGASGAVGVASWGDVVGIDKPGPPPGPYPRRRAGARGGRRPDRYGRRPTSPSASS